MNIFKRKRQEKQVFLSDMANYLEMNINTYNDVERGLLEMPTNLVDRFNDILNKGTNELKLLHLESEKKVEAWWNDIVKPVNENGTNYKLKELMMKFNIPSIKELSSLLGYASPSVLFPYLQGKKIANYDIKNKLYTFFTNPLNVQNTMKKDKKEKNTVKGKTTKNKNYNRLSYNADWLRHYDIKTMLYANNLSIAAFAKLCDFNAATLWRLISKLNKTLPHRSSCDKLFNFLSTNYPQYYNSDMIYNTFGISDETNTNVSRLVTNTPVEAVEENVDDEKPLDEVFTMSSDCEFEMPELPIKTEKVSKTTKNDKISSVIEHYNEEINKNFVKIEKLNQEISELLSINSYFAEFINKLTEVRDCDNE